MISLAQKSRHCLIDEIKGLETKFLQLQGRFDLIVNWIRSEYCDLNGLPDYVIIAIIGDRKSCENDVFGKTEHIKEEYDNLDDVSADGDIDTDNSSKKLLAKVDDDILKDIESGPVSRLRIQLEKRNLACRDTSQDEAGRRNVSHCKAPTAVHEETSSFPVLIEGDVNLKWENDRLVDTDSVNEHVTEGNVYTTPHQPYDDFEQSSREETVNLGSGKPKRIKKTAKHLQANKEKGLILDAIEYKRMIESLPKDRLTCVICNKDFATSTQVRRHEVQVHLTKEEQSKVRNRSSSFSTFNVVQLKSDVAEMCDICNKTFKNIESHRMNHLPTEVMTTVEGKWRPHYRCLKCDSLFSEKKKYLTHVTNECKNEKVLENSNYAQHAQKLRTERNFLCNQCGQAFNRKHTLKIHVTAVHAKRKDFKCKFCDKGFAIEFVKNNHEKKHLGTLSVTCELCGFAFTCRQTLRKHIKGVHENHRPYQCPLCDKRFKTNNARNYHVNTHGNPNGRKRGLNVEVDPLKAAAKRRHCSTWQNNRVPTVTVTAAENKVALCDGANEMDRE